MLGVSRYFIQIDALIRVNKAEVSVKYVLTHYNGHQNWNNIRKNAHILLF